MTNKIFERPQDLYLASADKINFILEKTAKIQNLLKGPDIDTYYSVIGGLSGLNHLSALRPKKIVFFDVNDVSLTYCNFIIEFIKCCNSPKDFISSFFARNVDSFLKLHNIEDLDERNQFRFLEDNIDKYILENTLNKLSPESQNIYENYILPLVKGEVPAAPRNCRRLLPCWHPDLTVPVGVGTGHGPDEFGAPTINTNTFFYGHGWLSSQESYEKVRNNLSRATVEVKKMNFLEENFYFAQDEIFVFHISNIDDWFPKETQSVLQRLHQVVQNNKAQYGIVSTLRNFFSFSKNPHVSAFDAVNRFVDLPLVEVTHIKPWGFHEYERENLLVDEFLSKNMPNKNNCIIVHILYGEGVEKTKARDVIEKAMKNYKRILILEHNKASIDFVGAPSHFITWQELEKITNDIIAKNDIKFEDTQKIWVRGNAAADRNMLFYFEKKL